MHALCVLLYCSCVHSCTDNGLCTCCVLLPPGTFPVCHRRRTRSCRTGAAFVGVRRCALTEDAFEWNLKCMRSVSRSIVVAFIVALTTSYIRVVYSCGQVFSDLSSSSDPWL